MGTKVDLTGQRFDLLEVLYDTGRRDEYGNIFWMCRCDCGKEHVVIRNALRQGRTGSCGCRTEMRDLSGKRFGRLTVLNFDEKRDKTYYWNCVCDCGKKTSSNRMSLINGITTSCGCKRVETSRINGALSNKTAKHEDANARRIFYQYGRMAHARQLCFDLAYDHFLEITSAACYYCSIEPKQICHRSKTARPFVYNGIDRKDNTRGYTEDNVVACCGRCNHAKDIHSDTDFIDWALRVARNTEQRSQRGI